MVDQTRPLITWYATPKDGDQLLQDMIRDIDNSPQDIYIISFILTSSKLIKALINTPYLIHIVHDYSQFNPTVKSILKPLVDAGGDVTLTYMDGGAGKQYICHEKSIVIEGTHPIIYTGSLNFTTTGFKEANCVSRFTSKIWATSFLDRFLAYQTFGKQHIKQPFV